MKKILATITILGTLVGVAACSLFSSPEQKACMRTAELCGVKDGTKKDLDQCVGNIEQWRKIAGDATVDKGMQCVAEAKSCGEAMGCTAGAGLKMMPGLLNDFMKGLGKNPQ